MDIATTLAEDADRAEIAIEGLARPVTLMHITDSHMVEWDARDVQIEEDGRQKRESFMQRTPNNRPMSQLFIEQLDRGVAADVDAFLLSGDMIHFPAYAGIELIRDALAKTGKPYIYVTGNHDWLFPFETYNESTRAAYYSRFHGLMGCDPSAQALDVGGVRIIGLDNSIHQLSETQVDFLEKQLASGLPCVVCMHMPLYLPDLDLLVREKWKSPIMMGVPASEEVRTKWPELVPAAPTRKGVEVLLSENAANLAAICCGHVHFPHAGLVRPNCFQYVTQPCFEGGYRMIRLVPMN